MLAVFNRNSEIGEAFKHTGIFIPGFKIAFPEFDKSSALTEIRSLDAFNCVRKFLCRENRWTCTGKVTDRI
jgi:hypothetical protein